MIISVQLFGVKMTQESISVSKRIYLFLQLMITGLNAMIFLPALLYKAGFAGVSKVLYFMLGFLCHQMPQRSFFLFGEKFMYSQEELLKTLSWGQTFTLDIKTRFTCSPEYGCKFGVCSRCTGIYTGLFTGMVGAGVVRKTKIPKPIFLIALIPMAIDGTTQFIAAILNPGHPFYESNNQLRFVTGFLFGLGFSLFAFTKLQQELEDAQTFVDQSKESSYNSI